MNPFVAFVEKEKFVKAQPFSSVTPLVSPLLRQAVGGHSRNLPEHPAEIARVVIAAGLGDFGNGVAGIQQHLTGVGNPGT